MSDVSLVSHVPVEGDQGVCGALVSHLSHSSSKLRLVTIPSFKASLKLDCSFF